MDKKDEISFREVVKQTEAYIRYLFSKWLIIVIAGIIGGILGLVYAFNATPTYTASLNFVLSSNSSSGGGGLLGFANQFGINLGSSGDDVFSGDNIITLMQSRRMVQQALFTTLPNSNKSLVNLLVEDEKWNEGWAKDDKMKSIYPFPPSPDKMSLLQDSIFRKIYSNVQTNMLTISKPDKDENIYDVTTTAENPLFAYYLTKYLVDATSSFYIDTKTSVARENLTMLQSEADSLRKVLGNTIVSTGSQTDYTFNLNPAYQVQRAGAQQSQASAAALGQAYGQVLQSLELAKIALQKETPLYQIIDEPTLPLDQDKPGKLLSLIIGGFIAGFLVVIFLIFRRLYTDFKKSQ
ncbi:MAG TPA: Wzz/FepE/Etk N-terminal domain-containing protein [Parafilimonas sp.]|nr:Wzz/FepE/Etk N-terminal domain-containing protein [Parafilimonas sp.]